MDRDSEEHLRRIATPVLFGETISEGKRPPARHLTYMSDRIVTRFMETYGTQRRSYIALFVTVRHGKTTLVGHDYPGWLMGLFPAISILFISYNEDRAVVWSVKLRKTMEAWSYALFGVDCPKNQSGVLWQLANGSTFRAAGPGSSITGEGFDIIIIDDPIKNAEEADSDANKLALQRFYDETLRNRLNPGGQMIFAMARWRVDDLAAYVVEGEGGDNWEVIRFPAIADVPDDEDPETWRDEIGRKEGDPLWPEVRDLEFLMEEKAASKDPRAWNSLFQQRPVPDTGQLFDDSKWVKIGKLPEEGLRGRVRAWDLAATNKGGDYTVGVKMCVSMSGLVIIEHVARERLDPAGVQNMIVQQAYLDGFDTLIIMEEEKGASGKANSNTYARMLVGYTFIPIPVSGDVAMRARAYAAHQGNGHVALLCDGTWDDAAFIKEHKLFGYTRHDDQVDAASRAFRALVQDGMGTAMASMVSIPGEDDHPMVREAHAFDDYDGESYYAVMDRFE